MKKINLCSRLFIIVLTFFFVSLFLRYNNTYAIYKNTLHTTIDLTILDPSTSFVVTFNENYTGGSTRNVYKTYNDTLGTDYTTPTRTDYNFLGWYTQDGAKVSPNTTVTGPITYYAHWQKIVCKKVTDATKLHQEKCNPSNTSGCRTSGTGIAQNDQITYGTVPGNNGTIAGDAYDCDVNADGTYDGVVTSSGKYSERFYFLRTIENGAGTDDSAALVYYTSIDADGRVDMPPKTKDDIGSYGYVDALAKLPTSVMSNNPWDNPDLIDFDQNGTVSRFLIVDDIEAACGPIAATNKVASSSYFTNCGKWFIFETSRFQSNNLGRAGIWLSQYGNTYHRIQTSTLQLAIPDTGANSENMVRPVIEIPVTALEGYVPLERYTISINSHGGTTVNSFYRYSGETLGTIPTTTRDHYDFDGWYATFENDTYSDLVSSSTPVTGDMTLHAKWLPKVTHTVTFDADGGTINGEPSIDLIVDHGDTVSASDIPEPTYTGMTFDGWFIDGDSTTPFTSSTVINDDMTVVAAWSVETNYVAMVNNVGYETLADAIDAVPTTGVKTTVTILKDITLTEGVTIPNTKWVELDIGEKTITGSFSAAGNMITNSGKLDIISGEMIFTNYISTNATKNIVNTSGATLNISGNCTLTNEGTNTTNNTVDHPVIENTGGTVNITGGVLNSNGFAASINNKSGTINMSGGRIIGHSVTKGQAIYMEKGTVNIRGNAYLENTSGTGDSRAAVDNNGGTLNITGGTIVSKGYSAVIARKNGSTTRIGTSENPQVINTTTPVLRGKRYGLEKASGSTANIEVYDGIFESLDETPAISTTNVTKPEDINFKTDDTVIVDGVTYNAAYLLAPSVTIYFYEETNGTPISVTLNNGSTIGSDLPTPSSKQGYYFAGWFVGNEQITSTKQVTATFNAYAKWVQSVSNATFDNTMSITLNESDTIEFEEDDIEDVTYSTSDDTVATVDADGTVHAVGVGTATITITGSLSNDTETVTVTVTQIMRTVKFYDADYDPNDLEHSTLIDSVQVASGSRVAAGDIPTATPPSANYVFAGWFIDGDGTTPFTSSVTVNEDLIVVASWNEKITYATLSTSTTPFKVIVGSTGQITIEPTITGDTVEPYRFTSGNTNYATVGETTGLVTGVGMGNTNITVTGTLSGLTVPVSVSVDILKYTVTFKDGNTVITSLEVPANSSITSANLNMPANPTKASHIFNGWVYEDNSVITPFTSAVQVSDDIDVLASWKEEIDIATLPEDPLTIMLGNSKEIIVSPTGEGNLVEDYTLSSSNTNIVEVNGKTITGASVGTVTLTITGAESHKPETITVEVLDSYAVTFDPDNGGTPTVIYVEVGSTIDESGETVPQDPTKTGYLFDSWYIYDEINETLTSTRINTAATVSSDITYKAKWTDEENVAVINTTTGPVYYTSLALALNGAPTGTETEIRIIKDIPNLTCSKTETPATCDTANDKRTMVPLNKNIILNGGSHTVSCGADTAKNLIYNKGTLRIVSGTFSCGNSGLATLENNVGANMYIDGGVIENTNDRAAIFNNGSVDISGGTLTSTATARGVVQNANASSSINMSGGTVNQLASSNMGALHNGISGSSITITGGTVTSVGNAIQNASGTTLIVGTPNNVYDATSPVIQGDKYGITSNVDYSIYDGIIKGKSSNQAVNEFSKITGTEPGSERETGTDGAYYTLYYNIANAKYHIDFNANNGTVTPAYKEFYLNSPITASDLPEPTRTNYTFDGWYTDSNLQTPFATFTPTSVDTVTYYAKWTYSSSSFTPVSHNILSNAMQDYFSNVSAWVATDATDPSNEAPNTVPPQTQSAAANYDNGHHLFKASIDEVFTDNGCSPCGQDNACGSPQAGVYCDQPGGYNTGLSEDLNVYLYENGTKGSLVTYTTSTGGVIYNMIPGVTYLWESATDNTKYGVVSATGSRRTLKTSVRNLRDLGGLSASNSDVSGTIDYGRLYRGAQITSQQGVDDLEKLGITREVDLRGNNDGNQTYKMDYYDTGTSSSYTDIIITNYIINPVATTYITDPHSTNYRAVKSAMRAIMEKVVFEHDSVFFHCTIGTDRTGTMAYFLEGLLGVSEEDRLRDYEMTYFFGLTNRTRFHDSVSWSGTNPRFYSMYRSYPTNQDIYNYYVYEPHVVDSNNPNDLTDDELLRRFRLELIH